MGKDFFSVKVWLINWVCFQKIKKKSLVLKFVLSSYAFGISQEKFDSEVIGIIIGQYYITYR